MNQNDGSKREDSNLTREEALARYKQRMEDNSPVKKGMSDFTKAMLWTAITTVFLSLIALLGGIIAAIVFHAKGEHEISRGIWTGLAIGISVIIVGLGITCFAMMLSL
jgi:hypothetical protein